jgi:hypothetical protein
MSDLNMYFLATARKDAAYNLYNYSGSHLENAQIKERLAEIKSQHEPLASLENEKMSERKRLYAAAFYVVVGRMPEKDATP